MRRRAETKLEKRVKSGMQKVVQRELRARKLGRDEGRKAGRRGEEVRGLVGVVGEFGYAGARRWGRGNVV